MKKIFSYCLIIVIVLVSMSCKVTKYYTMSDGYDGSYQNSRENRNYNNIESRYSQSQNQRKRGVSLYFGYGRNANTYYNNQYSRNYYPVYNGNYPNYRTGYPTYPRYDRYGNIYPYGSNPSYYYTTPPRNYGISFSTMFRY